MSAKNDRPFNRVKTLPEGLAGNSRNLADQEFE